MGGAADPKLTRPFPVCYLAKHGHSEFKDVGINRGKLKNWEALGLHPHEMRRGMDDPLKASPSHVCYHIKFGHSASMGVLINKREPPKLGSAGAPPLGMGDMTDPKKQAPPIYVTCRMWSFCVRC